MSEPRYNALNPAGGGEDLVWDADKQQALRDAAGITTIITRLDAADTALGQADAALGQSITALENRATASEQGLAQVAIDRAPMQRPVLSRPGPALVLQQSDLGAYANTIHFADSSLTIPPDLAPTTEAKAGESFVFNSSPGRRTILAGTGVTLVKPPGDAVMPAYTAALVTYISANVWNVVLYGKADAVNGTPVCTAIPVLKGAHILGQTLEFYSRAEWEEEPSEGVAIQWYRNQTPISGATGTSYVLTADDIGAVISVQEVATNEAGSTYVGSLDTAVVDIGLWMDSVNGDDSKTGIGQANAVRTPTRMMAIVGADASNKNIVVVRGSRFLETLTLTGNDVTVIAVGTGAKPIFDCTAQILSFTKTAGFANLYEATVTLPGNTKIEGNVWADGVCLQQVTTLSNCDATPARVFVSDWTAAEATIYVHAAGSVAPITADGKVYTFSERQFGIFTTGDRVKIIGIHGHGNAHQDGSLKMAGRDSYVESCHFSGGCRHYLYVQAGARLVDVTFASDGGNWLEAPFGYNSVVCNQTNILGESWTITGTTFGDEQGTAGTIQLTGPLMHGSNPNDLFLKIDMVDCVFRRVSSLGSLAAEQTNVIRPVYDRVTGGFGWGVPGNNVLIEGGTGTINQVTNVTAGTSIVSRNNNVTIPYIGVGFFRMNSGSSNLALTLENDTYTVIDGDPVGINSKLIHHFRGAISITGTRLLPIMCGITDDIVNAGFSGGNASYTGANNVWPIGVKFQINGTTYWNLDELQTAGIDTTSTTAPIPAPVTSDDFNRANENLDVSAGWTFVSGTANVMGIVSNALNSIVATSVNSYYRKAVMASPDHWAKFTMPIQATVVTPYVALRAIDENNALIFRANQFTYQLYMVIGGVTTQIINAGAIVPAAGDIVLLALRGTKVWLYVMRAGKGLSGARMLSKSVTVTAPTLAAATGVGVIRRGGSVTTFIDNVEFGLTPAIV